MPPKTEAKKDPAVVRELAPHEKNPRRISAPRLAQLGKSMAKFGDLSGIVWNRRTQRLVAGHQRVKHLQANAKIRKAPASDDCGTVAIGAITNGRASWTYREIDVDEATEKAMLIAANAAGGDFDETKLPGLVLELDQAGFEMDLLNLASLESILQDAHAAEVATLEDDEPAPPKKAVSKRGDVWVLGDHRLICGDSTSQADVQRLMGHEAAACVNTDPPYGVSYNSKSGEFEVIAGDRKRDDELHALVTGALKQAVAFTRDDAAFYIWHASATRRDFDDALRDAGLVEKQYLIWVKNALVLGRADYHYAHEPCYYACKQGHRPAYHGDRAQATVWRVTLKRRAGLATTLGQGVALMDGQGGGIALLPKFPKGKKPRTARLEIGQTIFIEAAANGTTVFEIGRDQDGYVHPTQKPVELAVRAIKNSSRPGEIVLDLFGGSGSTLLAAEATGRRARLCEIDPRYVDAIVKRWEDATGRKATREPAA